MGGERGEGYYSLDRAAETIALSAGGCSISISALPDSPPTTPCGTYTCESVEGGRSVREGEASSTDTLSLSAHTTNSSRHNTNTPFSRLSRGRGGGEGGRGINSPSLPHEIGGGGSAAEEEEGGSTDTLSLSTPHTRHNTNIPFSRLSRGRGGGEGGRGTNSNPLSLPREMLESVDNGIALMCIGESEMYGPTTHVDVLYLQHPPRTVNVSPHHTNNGTATANTTSTRPHSIGIGVLTPTPRPFSASVSFFFFFHLWETHDLAQASRVLVNFGDRQGLKRLIVLVLAC